MSLPYMYYYNQGDLADSATGNDARYGAFSLGNIGQSQERCVKQDIRTCNTVDIKCPANSNIRELKQFGLNDLSKKSSCPISMSKSEKIKLNLKNKCDLPRGLEKK